jgi:hypothetical protein
MMFRNNRPRRPTEQVSSGQLVNELLIVLRSVVDCEEDLASLNSVIVYVRDRAFFPGRLFYRILRPSNI